MFSKACEYAIKAALHVAHTSQQGERVGIKAIADATDSPVPFTGKIMQQLSRNGIVQSVKGPSGGFWMDEQQLRVVSVRDVVEVIDGDKLYVKCGLGLEECGEERPCPVHHQYKKVRDAIIKMHSKTTLSELATKLDGEAILK